MDSHRMDESQRELYLCCLFFPWRDNREPSPGEQRTINRFRAKFPEECRLLESELDRKTVERNGTEYQFGPTGFTVHIQERVGEYHMVLRGIIAASPQDAVELAKEWYGFIEIANAKVYPGQDGWYGADEYVYEC